MCCLAQKFFQIFNVMVYVLNNRKVTVIKSVIYLIIKEPPSSEVNHIPVLPIPPAPHIPDRNMNSIHATSAILKTYIFKCF